MDKKDLAKRIADKLTKCSSPASTNKEAAMDKELTDLFGNPSLPEPVSDTPETTDKDLFGFDASDRENAVLPPAVENSDTTDGDEPDLSEDLAQGDAANNNADTHYAGSGDGPKLSEG